MDKDTLSKLATKATSSVTDKFERKISRQGAVRAGERFTLFISNEDMDDIMILLKYGWSNMVTEWKTYKRRIRS